MLREEEFPVADECPAHREAVEEAIEKGEPGCPICGEGPEMHERKGSTAWRAHNPALKP